MSSKLLAGRMHSLTHSYSLWLVLGFPDSHDLRHLARERRQHRQERQQPIPAKCLAKNVLPVTAKSP